MLLCPLLKSHLCAHGGGLAPLGDGTRDGELGARERDDAPVHGIEMHALLRPLALPVVLGCTGHGTQVSTRLSMDNVLAGGGVMVVRGPLTLS